MARVISVFLPLWPTDRLRRQAGDSAPLAEAPLIIAGRVGNRRLITAVDAAASLGLRVGMPVSKAQALVPGLRIEAADPAADRASLEQLAFWVLQRIAPIVAVDPPDGIIIDSTGTDHLHGGEQAMLDVLIGRLTLSGVSARAAIADTWGAAHALARHAANPSLIASGADLLQPLPLEALRLPAAMAVGLRDLGFVSIGDLLAQPRAPLTRRFGPELCRRLDQAMGDLAEPIAPLRPEGVLEVRRVFAEPIAAAETIARYLGKLAVQLCERLDERGHGLRRVDLICTRVDMRKLRCAIYTRKSSEEGLEQEFNSLHAQREASEAYIASQRSEGWVLIRDQYDDGGISGGTLDRPGLKRLLEDIEDGLVDVVVVYKIDRLSRSLADFAKLVDVFDRNGVTFVWRRWSGYHRRSRVETKIHCVKLLGQRLMARDFDRQVAELQVRIAVLNGYTALGIPVTEAAGSVRPEKGEPWPSAELCNRAPANSLVVVALHLAP